jgi:hypothetical protein
MPPTPSSAHLNRLKRPGTDNRKPPESRGLRSVVVGHGGACASLRLGRDASLFYCYREPAQIGVYQQSDLLAT